MTKDKYNLFRRKAAVKLPQAEGALLIRKKEKAKLTAVPPEMQVRHMNLGESCDISLPKIAESPRVNPTRFIYRPRRAACPAPHTAAAPVTLFPIQTRGAPNPTSHFFNSVSSLFPGVKAVPERTVLKDVDVAPPPPPGSRAAKLRDFVATYF